MLSSRNCNLQPLFQMWTGRAQSCWLSVKDRVCGKWEEVTGEGPPVTRQEPASPVTVTSHDFNISANNQTPLKHRVRQANHVAKLIGKRCRLTCYLDGVKTDMLLDSRAQVTTLGKDWLEKHLPDVQRPPAR